LLIIFDVEGVLFDAEYLPILGEKLNKEKEIWEITKKGIQGEINWEDGLKTRVDLLRGIDLKTCKEIADSLPIMTGAKEACRALKEAGWKLMAISGGFTIMTDRLKEELGLDHVFSNELKFTNGKLDGVKIIVDSDKAKSARIKIQEWNVQKEDIVVVVDGANDIKLFDICGLGIGYRAQDLVKDLATVTLEEKNLGKILDIINQHYHLKIESPTIAQPSSFFTIVNNILQSSLLINSMTLEVFPIKINKDVQKDEKIIDLILSSSKQKIQDGDIFVISQKIISKQEGRTVHLSEIIPSELAVGIGAAYNKDPKLVEAILSESKRIIRMHNDILIVETHHGFICANAGVDESNVENGYATLLPIDPDKSALTLQTKLHEKTKKKVAVIISDTFGRSFRMGQTDVAIGIAGMDSILDYAGTKDHFGKILRVTAIAISDEICSAAELVMGKTRNCPVAIVRNYEYKQSDSNINSLIRPENEDLFR